MAYHLKEITIRTNNTVEGIKKIEEVWNDVIQGRLAILFDSENIFQKGISPVSRYGNYENDENGNYDFSILAVNSDFFKALEMGVEKKQYKKYDFSGDTIEACTKKAWESVWEEQKNNIIDRAYTFDYESTVPSEYSKDQKIHCYLYISIK